MKNGEEVKKMLKNFRIFLILHKINSESVVAGVVERASLREEEFSEALEIEINEYCKPLEREVAP